MDNIIKPAQSQTETAVPENQPAVQKAPEPIPAVETVSSVAPTPPPQNDQTAAQQPPQPAPSQTTAGIVNKANTKEKLHPIEHPKDRLTSLADQEEEEFIEKVETAHDIN